MRRVSLFWTAWASFSITCNSIERCALVKKDNFCPSLSANLQHYDVSLCIQNLSEDSLIKSPIAPKHRVGRQNMDIY